MGVKMMRQHMIGEQQRVKSGFPDTQCLCPFSVRDCTALGTTPSTPGTAVGTTRT